MASFAISPKQVNSLAYTGSDLYFVPATQHPRAPTIKDRNYPLMTFWRNSDHAAQSPDAYGDVWVLRKLVYNATTDQLDADWFKISSGSGSAGIQTLTPNSGGAVSPDGGGNVNVFGQAAGTVQVQDTLNVAGNFIVENRAWDTQYVVDPSSVVGLRGTFTTLQAALNQAVADGMAFNNPRKILIRAKNIVEDLVIPGGAMLYGANFTLPTDGVLTPLSPSITGNHTFSGNAVVGFNNIQFVNPTSSPLFTGGAIVLGYMNGCNFLGSDPSASHFLVSSSSSTINFTNCAFVGNSTIAIDSVGGGNNFNFTSCRCPGGGYIRLAGGQANFYSCYGFGGVDLTTSDSFVQAFGCEFAEFIRPFNFTGIGSGVLNGCLFGGAACALQSTTGTGGNPWKIHQCSIGILSDAGSSQNILYEDGTPVLSVGMAQQGSIVKSVVVNGDPYNVRGQDHYVGVDTSVIPITVNLPDGTTGIANQDQCFIIKDESGLAATNPITITTLGGTITIDGVTSYVINVNYASITVKFNGTNYFII